MRRPSVVAAPLVIALLVIALLVIVLTLAGAAVAGPEPVARHVPSDMKRARALVLARADLGTGWVAERASDKATADRTTSSTLRCAGYEPNLSGLIETGAAAGASLSFDDGDAFYSVGSAATVMKTESMTSIAWNRSVRPAIVSCLRGAFVRGLQLGSTGQGAAPLVTFGASRTFEPSAPTARKAGFRITASILFRDRGSSPLPVVIDVVFLSRGRSLTFATIASLGSSPPPGLERAISTRLAERLERPARTPSA